LVVEVSKEAAQELEESAAWYEKEDPGLGARLVDAFAHAVRLLEEPNPPLTPVAGKAGRRGGQTIASASPSLFPRYPEPWVDHGCHRIPPSFPQAGLLGGSRLAFQPCGSSTVVEGNAFKRKRKWLTTISASAYCANTTGRLVWIPVLKHTLSAVVSTDRMRYFCAHDQSMVG